jgi:hypothetical protein
LLHAGVACVSGDEARARNHLHAGIQRLEANNMELYAAAARYALGEIGKNADVRERGERALYAAGVTEPRRASAMLVPGWT